MMQSNFFQKFKLENISLKLAPLVPHPFASFSQYSDFFPFVINSNYTTILYALNFSFLLKPQSKQSESVIISIFDREGALIRDLALPLDANVLFTPINLAGYLPLDSSGSFMIYHQCNPLVSDLSPVIADRSYISLVKLHSNFQHFVHGNQDCFVYSNDPHQVRCLSPSPVPRFYRPQFIFQANYLYTLIFSNPTNKRLLFVIKFKNLNFKSFYRTCVIPPFGTKFFEVSPQLSPFYITIISNHPFPRPIIITGGLNQIFDIFHS